MKLIHIGLLSLILLTLASGCATRSISNPGRPWRGTNSTYSGELSDFDVVGVAPGMLVDADEVVLKPHARVLVIQSGAVFPDERMLNGLAAQFEVGTASGIPTPGLQEHGMVHAAAMGRFDAVVAYWGVLETSEHATAGAAAVWIPIVGSFVPDTKQRMRIRLRIVILDVRSGRWRTILPPPIDDERASSGVTRQSSDADQVELLMSAAISEAVQALMPASR